VFGVVSSEAQVRRFRLAAWLGLLLPIAILIASYLAIATYSSTPLLWSVIVHESGDRTLQQTIFYYEHAAREIPLDIILGVAVAGSALFVIPPAVSQRAHSRVTGFAAGLAAATAFILGGTLWTGGIPMLTENILQYPTRPGEPLAWGGHWRYHLLSHVTLMLASFGLAAPILILTGRSKGYEDGLRTLAVAVGAFLALAVLFVPGSDSFSNSVYIGHQAREVATHAIVTVPLALSTCLFLGRHAWGGRTAGTSPLAVALIVGGVGVLVGLFLVIASLVTSAASQGQSDSLAVLIFPHVFEHTFSYVMTTLSAGLVFEWARHSATREVSSRARA
jgi:hypothetical protein